MNMATPVQLLLKRCIGVREVRSNPVLVLPEAIVFKRNVIRELNIHAILRHDDIAVSEQLD